MFFLENAFIIPAIPVASFFLILAFGKKLPGKGSEIGVAALAAAFALSCIAVFQWVDQPADYEPHLEPAASAGHAEEDSHATEDDAHASEEDSHASEDEAHEGETARAVAAEEEGDHGGEAAEEGGHGEEAHHEPIRHAVEKKVTWWENGAVKIEAGTHIDGVAVALLFVVTMISLLVHVFSREYMRDDPRKTHYFAALSLFTSGMLILVTAGNTLQALFGWEIMGLCSFMLIGHWWDRDGNKNSDAAMKAFFTTRTGDVGLLVGISILFFAAGQTFDIQAINDAALDGSISHGVLLAASCFLLLAVIGKSAQFPLHTWLPDAMAGPTPVSALIHAATMVVAGVYLIARLYGVFWEGFSIDAGGVNPIAAIGGITIIIAALLAFVQDDIKKVLAYSTVSQLGFMVMALGVGAWTAGIFHLFTHAFFKACLFLGAGSVSHSGSHHSFDMKKDMGGLAKHMPVTHATFLVASLALAGVPPLAGFWSKDEILLGAGEDGYTFFMVVGLVGAFMTACYMTRCVYLTFHGEYRGHHHPHESPKTLTVPLIILAVFSVGAGFLNAPGVLLFSEWTNNATGYNIGLAHHEFSITTALLSVVVGVGGIGIGCLYWFAGGLKALKGLTARNGAAKAGYTFLENKYYLDRLYTDMIVGGLKGPVARAAYWFNQKVIDGIVNGVGVGARLVARFTYEVLDQKGVDGIVNGAGVTASESGGILRTIQTGRVQQYAAILFGAVGIFAVALILFVNS